MKDANVREAVAARGGSPEASAVIWDWQGDPAAAAPRAARTRGVLRGLVGVVLGVVLYLRVSAPMGVLAWAVSAVVLGSALLSPAGAYAGIERAVDRVAGLVGRGVTPLVLAPIFFLVFVPFGRLFRRGRNDTMTRFYDSSVPTYWTARDAPAPDDRERLF